MTDRTFVRHFAPALYGGIQIGIHDGTRWRSERVSTPPGLQAVVFIPSDIGTTSKARAVLKKEVDRSDAVFNIGRVAWLVNALASNNLENLKFGVEDRIHQPQRGEAVYAHLYPMIRAATEAGARPLPSLPPSPPSATRRTFSRARARVALSPRGHVLSLTRASSHSSRRLTLDANSLSRRAPQARPRATSRARAPRSSRSRRARRATYSRSARRSASTTPSRPR